MKFRFPILLMLLLSSLSAAAGTEELAPKSAETMRLLDKAEQLYRDGHWDRAYFIYVNELAAIGDKYAQYMAGYMNLAGKGVPQSTVNASAWYRLAAERGSPEFAAVRDKLLEAMSEADREASDAAYLALRQQYSDLVLVLGYLRQEREALNSRQPRYLPSGDLALTYVVDSATGITMTRAEYRRRLEARMQARLDFISSTLGIDSKDPDISDQEFDALAAKVDEYLQVINDR